MSSSFNRAPMDALIRQDSRVIGSICLPEEDIQDFIEHFNYCYGPMRLKIEPPDYLELLPKSMLPIGAEFRPSLRRKPGAD